jgi:hypothetical protein
MIVKVRVSDGTSRLTMETGVLQNSDLPRSAVVLQDPEPPGTFEVRFPMIYRCWASA